MLEPRQWRCNVLYKRSHQETVDGLENSEAFKVDDGVELCRESEPYRWWRSLDRKVFAILEVNERMRHYYCPVCESFFWLDLETAEAGYNPPYFRLCSKCLQIGVEHTLPSA